MQGIITIITILTLIVSLSAQELKTEMIKSDSTGTDTLQIIAYGHGRSFGGNKMARRRAAMEARSNLAQQVAGLDFSYQKSGNSVSFRTQTNAKITGSQVLEYYDIDDKNSLAVINLKMPDKPSDTGEAIHFKSIFRTDNLDRSLQEKYREAVKKYVSEEAADKSEVKGKIYLNDMAVTDFEGKADFAVTIRFTILFSE